jgi:hypothetical protein
MLLNIVRYGLPGALLVAAFVVLVAVNGSLRYDGFAMLLGSGLSVALFNLLYRLGVAGDLERDDEERAREFFSAHGYWRDERPRDDAR